MRASSKALKPHIGRELFRIRTFVGDNERRHEQGEDDRPRHANEDDERHVSRQEFLHLTPLLDKSRSPLCPHICCGAMYRQGIFLPSSSAQFSRLRKKKKCRGGLRRRLSRAPRESQGAETAGETAPEAPQRDHEHLSFGQSRQYAGTPPCRDRPCPIDFAAKWAWPSGSVRQRGSRGFGGGVPRGRQHRR